MTPSASAATLILERLKANPDGYVSGPSLAEELSITRTAIWKHVQALTVRGYTIDRQPRLGYRLIAVPDLLLPEEILPLLHTTWLGRSYVHHMKTGSTNQDALNLAAQGAPHGTTVVAEHQTAGRGRLRRIWNSPENSGIYVSLLFTAPLPAHRAPQAPLVIALALARILRSRFALNASIKWPNDVLISGRKVSGILAEMQLDQDEVRHLVVGVGINVNQTEGQFVGDFRYPPTSLAIELNRHVSRKEVLVAFLEESEDVFDGLAEDGFANYLKEFENLSALLGKEVAVQTGDQSVVGVVRGFTTEGALRLLPKEGKPEEIIWAGDVSRLSGDFTQA
ncbi:MAG: biotin--[acetyl-CoA-carboxylase] ligase [Syntrophobacteraceae bacterium]